MKVSHSVRRAFLFVSALLVAVPCFGQSMVSVTGAAGMDASAAISSTTTPAIPFTLARAYTNVSISLSFRQNAPVKVHLTTQIGPGTTSAHELFTSTVTPPAVPDYVSANQVIYSGLDLDAGTYYLTFEPAGGSDPELVVIYYTSPTYTYVASVGVSLGWISYGEKAAGTYPPAATWSPVRHDHPIITMTGSPVGLIPQTISGFAASPSSGTVGGTSALSVTGTGASGNAVTYGSSTTSVCSISGHTVTYLAAGTCTVTADQAGNANYGAATQVSLNITVAKAAQTITGLAASPAGGTVGGASTLSVTGAGASGNAVGYASSTASVCTVSGSTVTYLAAGTCTVTADQAGNANYNAATQVSRNITVAKAAQTITGFAASSSGTVGGTATLSVTGSGASGNAVVYASTTASVCAISGTTVNYLAGGTCAVTANQAGNANYDAAAQVSINITVGATTQTITGFAASPASGTVGGTSTLSVTSSGASGNAVAYGSSTTSVCTVSGSTVSHLAGGTCTITADQAGNANYNAATQVSLNIAVGKLAQAISGLAALPASGTTGGTSTLSVTGGGASGSAIVYASSTASVCTVSGSTVTYLAAGTCTVTANQAGNATYNPASPVSLNITVPAAVPTLGETGRVVLAGCLLLMAVWQLAQRPRHC
jgi:hypothetical protein